MIIKITQDTLIKYYAEYERYFNDNFCFPAIIDFSDITIVGDFVKRLANVDITLARTYLEEDGFNIFTRYFKVDLYIDSIQILNNKAHITDITDDYIKIRVIQSLPDKDFLETAPDLVSAVDSTPTTDDNRVLPLCYGICRMVEPLLLISSTLRYWQAYNTIDNFYDGGEKTQYDFLDNNTIEKKYALKQEALVDINTSSTPKYRGSNTTNLSNLLASANVVSSNTDGYTVVYANPILLMAADVNNVDINAINNAKRGNGSVIVDVNNNKIINNNGTAENFTKKLGEVEQQDFVLGKIFKFNGNGLYDVLFKHDGSYMAFYPNPPAFGSTFELGTESNPFNFINLHCTQFKHKGTTFGATSPVIIGADYCWHIQTTYGSQQYSSPFSKNTDKLYLYSSGIETDLTTNIDGLPCIYFDGVDDYAECLTAAIAHAYLWFKKGFILQLKNSACTLLFYSDVDASNNLIIKCEKYDGDNVYTCEFITNIPYDSDKWFTVGLFNLFYTNFFITVDGKHAYKSNASGSIGASSANSNITLGKGEDSLGNTIYKEGYVRMIKGWSSLRQEQFDSPLIQ